MISRYLASCVYIKPIQKAEKPEVVTEPPSLKKQPEIVYDYNNGIKPVFLTAGYGFVETSQDNVNFINDCIAHGDNKDQIFNRQRTLQVLDIEGNSDKITGVVRLIENNDYGSKIIIARNKRNIDHLYENIEPIWLMTDKPNVPFSINERIKTKTGETGVIRIYTGSGFYDVLVDSANELDEPKLKSFHVNSFINLSKDDTKKKPVVKNKPAKSKKKEVLSDEERLELTGEYLLAWSKNEGLCKNQQITQSEHGNPQFSFAIKPNLSGVVTINKPDMIIVNYVLLGKASSVVLKSTKEFEDFVGMEFASVM